MMTRKVPALLVVFFLFAPAVTANAELSKEQAYSIFNQANEVFRQANSLAGDEKADRLYEKVILNYEKLVDEGQIKNAKLFYNLGNAYLLRENIGKAILNYRRAERLDNSDANIQKNLEFARSRRIDKITPIAKKRVLDTLFFWHYDFSLRTKFFLACLFFAAFCVALTVMIWLGRAAPTTATAVIAGILMLCFLVSVVVETRSRANAICGVITAADVIARQGDGQNYPAGFKDPLHAGTEFVVIEHRPGWLHIKLTDDNEGWIPDNTAELI